MKRIYLIDCPGVVPPSNNDSEEDILLRGVVRVENVENPEQYIAAVLKKTKPQHIERTYDVRGYNTATGFLELLARKGGRLLKGGEADVDGAAKMVLNDFLRGKIPWFTAPPVVQGEERKGVEGREGRLGEMGRKRKREGEQSTVEAVDESYETAPVSDDKDEVDPTDEDFEGFDDGDDEGGVELTPNEEAEDNDSNDEQVEGSRGEATELNHDNITLVSDDNSPNEQLDEEMQDELKNASLRLDIRSRKQRKKG